MYDMSYAEFTNEQVIKMLEGNRTIDFEYELMNNEEKVITTLDNVECSISFNSEAEIMGTASIRFRETEIRSYYTDLKFRHLIGPGFVIRLEYTSLQPQQDRMMGGKYTLMQTVMISRSYYKRIS